PVVEDALRGAIGDLPREGVVRVDLEARLSLGFPLPRLAGMARVVEVERALRGEEGQRVGASAGGPGRDRDGGGRAGRDVGGQGIDALRGERLRIELALPRGRG